MRAHRTITAIGVVSSALASGAWQAQAQEFFHGKQISLIVGSPSGGGYDLLGRLMARHLARHVPGNPTIIVQNMPAAGSIAAANHIARIAPRDGTVIGLMQRGILTAKLSNPTGVQFELGQLVWIGSLNSEASPAEVS